MEQGLSEPTGEPTQQRLTPQGQRERPLVNNQKAKVAKWLFRVARRLQGVPKFVVKRAIQLYGRASKDTKRQGCSEWALALASLDLVLHDNQLTFKKAELCEASAVQRSAGVKLDQLEASIRVVQRVQRQGAGSDGPKFSPPLAAHFAETLCAELQPRGQRVSVTSVSLLISPKGRMHACTHARMHIHT